MERSLAEKCSGQLQTRAEPINAPILKPKHHVVCNYDDGRCTADDGSPCPECEAELDRERQYYKAIYQTTSPLERDRRRYIQDMRSAGRGHLVAHLDD